VHRDFHRTIHLAQGTVSALTRHKRGVQAQERLRAGEIWQEHDLVFATEIGRPLEGGYVNELFKPEGWTRPTNGWYSPR